MAHHGAEPLALEGVSVHAEGRPEPVLHNIHLTVGPGEWVTLAGANGSGKSTLIGVIAGLIEPDEGRVRRGFAGHGPIPYVMQQDGPFFGDTPWEEVLFVLETGGVKGDLLRRAEEALLRTGLFPHRHRPLHALSGGQRQLASAAACLASGAPILLLDEATAMLDGISRSLVWQTAVRLHREGKTVIWCTHRLEETVRNGRIIVLKDGTVVHDGPTEDFFYGEREDGRTPCEAAGFVPPFAVRTARALIRKGLSPSILPLSGEELAAAWASGGVVHGG